MAIAFLLSFLLLPAACGEQAELTVEQRSASLAWLTLLDQGDYGLSWDQSSTFFQLAVDKPWWEQKVQSVRAPLGMLVAREYVRAKSVVNPQGQPDGSYLVLQYKSSFENRRKAIETHTLVLEPTSNSWRNAGYFIR